MTPDIAPPAPVAAIQTVAATFRQYGWNVEFPEVGVVPDDDISSGLAAGSFVAYAVPGRIVLTATTAGDFQILYRAASKGTLAKRRAALKACAVVCVGALEVALHEYGHIVQFANRQGEDGNAVIIEGGAEAVALDLLPVVWRRLGGRPVDIRVWRSAVGETYPWFTSEYRKLSAAATGTKWTSPQARAWRFQRLGIEKPQVISIGTAVEYDPKGAK